MGGKRRIKMAILRNKELNEMGKEALNTKFYDLKKELAKIRSQISLGTVPENPGRVKEIRRTIARILTYMNLNHNKNVKEVKKQTG